MDGDARELLGARGLGAFEAALVKLGVHAVGDLQFVRREDLEGIGMSLVQVRKFEQCASDAVIMQDSALDESPRVGVGAEASPRAVGGDGGSVHSGSTFQSGSAAGSSMGGGSVSERKSFFNKFSLFGRGSSKAGKGENGNSECERPSSVNLADDLASSPSRAGGGGYNGGGMQAGRADAALALDVRIVRLPRWDEAQALEAATGWLPVLQMYRGHVEWQQVSPAEGRPGCTPANAARGSRYYSAEMQVQRAGAQARVPAFKAVAQVRASVAQVMSLLLLDSTARLCERSVEWDGSFCGGQVLRVCAPRGDDWKQESYKFPEVPLCTVKRTVHTLPQTSQRRDFVFRDQCELRDVEGATWGFRPMLSIEMAECENRGDKAVVRGTLFEGSGWVVAPVGGDGSQQCEVALVLVADTDPGSRLGTSKATRAVKHLEALTSSVDALRVLVDAALKRYGSLANRDAGFPEPARAPGIARPGTPSPVSSVSGKAARMLLADGETLTISPPRSLPSGSRRNSAAEAPQVPPADLSSNSDTSDEASEAGEAGSQDGISRGSVTPPASKEEAEKRVREELDEMRRQYEARLLAEKQAKQLEFEQRLEEMRKTYEEQAAAAAEAVAIAAAAAAAAAASAPSAPSAGAAAPAERASAPAAPARAPALVLAAPAAERRNSTDEGLDEGGAGSGQGTPRNAGATLEDEIERLRRLLSKYREFLPKDVSEEDLEVTLHDAETRMKQAVQLLMSSEDPAEQMKAQADFDKWDSIVQNHPDYKERERLRWVKWEDDNRPKNKLALEQCREVIKERYFTSTPDRLAADGLAPLLAKRISQKKVFQLYFKTPEEINKLHHVALTGTYSSQGLDIVELRALYYALPAEFSNDAEGKKSTWRDNIRTKLDELIKKEESGQLRGEEKRSKAYSAAAAAPEPRPGEPPRLAGARPANPMAAGLAAMLAGRGAPRPPATADAPAAPRPAAPAGLMAALAARGAPADTSAAPRPAAPAGLMAALTARGPPPQARDEAARGPPAGLMAALAARGAPRPPLNEAPKLKPAVPDIDIMSSLEKSFGSKAPAAPVAAPSQATPAAPVAPPSKAMPAAPSAAPTLAPSATATATVPPAAATPATTAATATNPRNSPDPPSSKSAAPPAASVEPDLATFLEKSFASSSRGKAAPAAPAAPAPAAAAGAAPAAPPAAAPPAAAAGAKRVSKGDDDWQASLMSSLSSEFKKT